MSTPRLDLSSSLLQVDASLAKRRSGFKKKSEEAWAILQENLGIATVGDLIHHYPRRYIDRARVGSIRDLVVGQPATIIAHVQRVDTRLTRYKKTMVKVSLRDSSGGIDMTFFNQPWVANLYKAGMELAVSGVPTMYAGRMQMSNQEVEVLKGDGAELIHTGRMTPVHPATEGVTSRTIRGLVYAALEGLGALNDPMPSLLIRSESLGSYDWAIRHIHFPDDPQQLEEAKDRLKFDELFVLELGVAFRKRRLAAQSEGVAHKAQGELSSALLDSLPFEPTGSQRRAMTAVSEAMAKPHPMNILLQGDVGSGKTLVALHAALVAIQSGHQAAIMAPTEVLAAQHFISMTRLLEAVGGRPFLETIEPKKGASTKKNSGQASLLDMLDDSSGPSADAAADPPVSVAGTFGYALLTSGVSLADRREILEGLKDGRVRLIVGTHALVQETVAFQDLSLAVIDEQHRFGLHQRMILKDKAGGEVDMLTMTATPIPRTLAMTYYGDLDVVVLDEMPKGRQPIETLAARTAAERHKAEELVRREVAQGRQAFVVCAAIDEDNKTQVKAAEAEADRLATKVFPDIRVDLLHGRMKAADKSAVMERFRARESDVLISTTVIEVGVDVPNATVMMVENAERFGLAQLHQLRGRIGRGEHPSYCVLFDTSDPRNTDARARISAMVRTTDGFELADEDLRLRGEGTLFDTQQSGMPDLKLARLAEDAHLVVRARDRAFALIEEDPSLENHPELFAEMRGRFGGSIEWLFST